MADSSVPTEMQETFNMIHEALGRAVQKASADKDAQIKELSDQVARLTALCE
jgi:hypothetical protein